jgi:hypothetical protein
VIDASRTPEQVHQSVVRFVSELLRVE